MKTKRVIPVVAFPLSRENLRIEPCPTAWASCRDVNQKKKEPNRMVLCQK